MVPAKFFQGLYFISGLWADSAFTLVHGSAAMGTVSPASSYPFGMVLKLPPVAKLSVRQAHTLAVAQIPQKAPFSPV